MPEGISSRGYFASLIGPIFLSAALGVQLTLTAVLVVEPPAKPVNELTDYGAYIFTPEHDVPLYLGGVAFALLLGVTLTSAWNRRLRSVRGPVSEGVLYRLLLFQVAVAVGGTAFYLNQFLNARTLLQQGSEIPRSFLGSLAAIGAVSLGAAFTGWTFGRKKSGEPKSQKVPEEADGVAQPRLRWHLLDLAVPTGIVLLIYVPFWRHMAGRAFMEESLFHWDFYVMGPALAFSHGEALGSEVFSMYGLGWPLVFGGLSSWIPLSFGRMIQIGSIYACLYLAGVYLLLRLLVRRPALATLGTGLVALQFFLGGRDVVIWRFPSLTVMRWAFDVWCFLALVLYWKSKNRVWAVAGGAAVGLAVVFSTDTGLYLTAACGFYWLCTLGLRGDRVQPLIDAVSSGAAALVVLLTGLLIAGRGQVFNASFWKGWLESVLEFSQGYAQLPLATFPNGITVISFAVLFFLYLTVVVYSLARLLHKRALHFEVFNGFLAFYGLLNLLHFVGRSGDYTPFRLFIPLVIVLTNLAGRAYGPVVSYVQRRRGDERRFRFLLRSLPYAVTGVVILGVVATPSWLLLDPLRAYPNLISSTIEGAPAEGVCVMLEPKDICGLSPKLEDKTDDFRAIADRLRGFNLEGKSFAVLDEFGSFLSLASDAPPWGRYTRPFTSIYQKQHLKQYLDSLRSDSPDFIVSRMMLENDSSTSEDWPITVSRLGPGPDSPYADMWDEFNAVVHDLYRLESTMPPYGIWRLPEPNSRHLSS
jgi:hypothetical protein